MPSMWPSATFLEVFQSLWTEWSINPSEAVKRFKSSLELQFEREISYFQNVCETPCTLMRETRISRAGSRPFSSGSLKIWDASIGVKTLNLCYHSFHFSGVLWYTPEGTVILSLLFCRSGNWQCWTKRRKWNEIPILLSLRVFMKV